MEKQIIPQTMHYSCLIRKSYQCVIFVDTQLIQRVTNELCRSEEQMLLTSHMARVVAGHPSSPASRGGVNSSSQGTRLTHKTFKRRFCLSCSLARERTRPITQSVGDPPRTAHPTTTILSAHAHGKGLGTTRKMGPVARPGPPKHHTPRVLCRFRHDVSALARPSQWVLEATG